MNSPVLPLGEVAQIRNGYAFPSEAFRPVGVPVIRMSDLAEEQVTTKTAARVDVRFLAELPQFRIGPGSLLIGMSGSIGKVAVYSAAEPALQNQRVGLFCIKDKNVLDTLYLRFFALTLEAKLLQRGKGVAVKNVSAEDIEALPIPTPALLEQKRIATILEKADWLRRTRRYARELSDTFLESVFLEMFGDPMINFRGWPVVPLEELLAIPAHIGTTVPAGDVGEQLCVRVGEVGGWYVDLLSCKRVTLAGRALERFTVRPGDVLLARAIGSEEHLGKLSMLGPTFVPVVFDSHLMRLRPDESKIKTGYLTTLLHTKQGRSLFMRQARRTAVQFNINTEQISELRLPIPALSLQQKFAEIVRRVERLRAQQREAEHQAEHLFQTLLHRAFSSTM